MRILLCILGAGAVLSAQVQQPQPRYYPTDQEKHGIKGTPRYAPGAGFSFAMMTGNFQLAADSPGLDKGEVIPNFCDVFKGSAPDVGAQEAAAPSMVVGVKAQFNPSAAARD